MPRHVQPVKLAQFSGGAPPANSAIMHDLISLA
jgi:hypothetical protein